MLRLALAVLLTLATATAAHAQAGVRLTLDEEAVLVSRDFVGERWAIHWDLDSGAATGNVFKPTSATTAFVWCQLRDIVGDIENDLDNVQLHFGCFGAPICKPGNCPEWSFIRNIVLLGKFFLP